MTDIVERLRRKLAPRMDSDEIEELWSEAADEIERLRTVIEQAYSCLSDDDVPGAEAILKHTIAKAEGRS